MAGICFYYEDTDVDVWSGKDLDAWNYACKIGGGIDKSFVINTTAQTLHPFDVLMDFQVFTDLESALLAMAGSKTYFTTPWTPGNHASISGFNHMTDWYLFGPGAGWGQSLDGVFIPQAGGGAAHSVHAATHVMYHRFQTLNP
jgi:hypothetical protein